MENISLGYGNGSQTVQIPEENLLGCLKPQNKPAEIPGEEMIKKALANPIGTAPLSKIVAPGERVAIIISDITRPCPSFLLLPPVLEELNQAGVKDEDITIVSGLGVHRPHTAEEMKKLVGPQVYERFNCIDSYGGEGDFIQVGQSRIGTPFQVFRPVAEAAKRICLGNIDYHYFAGYSGGVKALVPGVCTRTTIQANHRMMLHPKAKVGIIEGNPVRADMEEVIEFLSIDFIFNVVLDEEKNLMAAVAGDFIQAHRAGCKILDQAYRLPIRELADIVVTSPHGFPKDINVYQAQKALDNARWAAKAGGIIILVAECGEGLGESTFSRWIGEAHHPQDVLKRIAQDFQLGGHKAAAIADMAEQFRIFLVSALPEKTVHKLFMEPFQEANQALQEALRIKGREAKIWVMPTGGTTLPQLVV
ncbi:nickel-dependent lactate racemase [Dehalobacterium formicoaceticum]|uniref:Nickel-dependent lactate racemase n=1 Tax=Dehalobacterium formicoaceticum TaxID=51515 RepID=A0ABT1Y0G8_9FIRM|nr:nickel-dependent lactate racemase [Dehalobacterium formicoaceticum]MCR6544006.1 nickel-dependent lactate racemase [Dehalobacterium formicoaceticum]